MTPERLRELYGNPNPRAAAKEIDHFDKHCIQFIQHATFLIIATSGSEHIDVSPKGDPAGFVTVEDEHHLLLPDRLGNNRLDGLMNILHNPQVSLLFMIPTVTETLRVNGVAEIVDDPAICETFAVRQKIPKTVTRITAHKVFIHCGKAPIRAGLWKPDTWPANRPVATLNEMIRDHTQMEVDCLSQEAADKLYEDTMY